MNVVDYCKGMEMELIAWKAKMFDSGGSGKLDRKVFFLSEALPG